MSVREKAVIESCEARVDRGYSMTVWVACDLKGGGHQGFGGYMLGKNESDEKEAGKRIQHEWIRELCGVFGLDDKADMPGVECFVLRNFDRHNETICGLEDPKTGRRFLAADFIRRHFPMAEVEDPLRREIDDIKARIARSKRDIHNAEASLLTIESKYRDWSVR